MSPLLVLLACGTPEAVRYSVPVAPTVEDPTAAVPTRSPPVSRAPFDCHAFDRDEDGVDLCSDCDDTDPTTWPGAPAVCFDGRDNSCGVSDEQPCPFEGVHRLGEVGAVAFGVETVASITDLWGDTAFVETSDAFPEAIHSGELEVQRPYRISEGVEDWWFTDAGDVDGDGGSDVFFWRNQEWEHVVRTDRLDPTADIVIEPTGTICGPSGDADGDGLVDLAVQASSTGTFTLYTHLQAGATYTEEDATAMFTYDDSPGYSYASFTASTDVDGDGLVDVVTDWVQTWDWTNRDGYIGVFLSPIEGSRDIHTGPFWDSSARIGNLVASAPPTLVDVDGDGRVELLSIGSLETNSEPGLLVVPFDATGAIDAAQIRLAWEDRTMSYVQLIGDVDGDARPELNVGRAVDGAWGTSVYPLPGIANDAEDALASFSLAEVGAIAVYYPSAGDLNDDGIPDIAVNYMADGRGPFPHYVVYTGGL